MVTKIVHFAYKIFPLQSPESKVPNSLTTVEWFYPWMWYYSVITKNVHELLLQRKELISSSDGNEIFSSRVPGLGSGAPNGKAKQNRSIQLEYRARPEGKKKGDPVSLFISRLEYGCYE